MLIKPHQEVKESRLVWNWLLKRRETADFLPESQEEKKKNRDVVCISEQARSTFKNNEIEQMTADIENNIADDILFGVVGVNK